MTYTSFDPECNCNNAGTRTVRFVLQGCKIVIGQNDNSPETDDSCGGWNH